MNKQDILIRLLKDRHITDEEFKFLYEDQTIDINKPLIPSRYPFDVEIVPLPDIWHVINHPLTGEPLCNPTYTIS